MKRFVCIAMLTVTSLSLCRAEESGQPAVAKTEAPATGGVPKIEFDKTVYDFGSTSLVQQLSGTFIISNTGTAPLAISKPTTSCGCTIAALKIDKLAPGEKTELGFTMNVSMPRGHAEKIITVPSNDPSNSSARLTIKADIVPVFEYTPQALDAGTIHIGGTTNLTIQVKRIDGKPLGSLTVDANAGYVHPTIEKVESETNSLTLHVEVIADGVARRFNNVINVHGEASGRPLFVIPVSGRIVGDVVLQPQQLVWGIPDPENWPGPQGAAATTKKVLVSPGSSDQKLEVKNLSCSVAEVKVTLNNIAGSQFEIVAVIDKAPKETVAGIIRFETNVSRQPVVEIPFTINVLRHN